MSRRSVATLRNGVVLFSLLFWGSHTPADTSTPLGPGVTVGQWAAIGGANQLLLGQVDEQPIFSDGFESGDTTAW